VKRRAELAGGEGVEGAEAGGEFGGGQAALAVEAAEKIIGGLFPFLSVAFHAAGDQVAVGVGPQARLRHDVVQSRWGTLSARHPTGCPTYAAGYSANHPRES